MFCQDGVDKIGAVTNLAWIFIWPSFFWLKYNSLINQESINQSTTYLGPLDDHVYAMPGNFSLSEYSAVIISGETYAPTPVDKP